MATFRVINVYFHCIMIIDWFTLNVAVGNSEAKPNDFIYSLVEF